MNRPETGTVPAKSWLQRLLAPEVVLARTSSDRIPITWPTS